jgi:hypothetical protein
MNEENLGLYYNVEFIGDYYNLITNVFASDEEQAEVKALANILREYGWDLQATYSQVEVIEEDNE